MSVSIGGTTGVTFSDASVQNTAATGFGFKNRIINGAMMIDQRNAGASVTVTTGGTYTLDRYATQASVTSKFTIQQNAGSITPPSGFINYLGCTSSSAYTVGTSETFGFYQPIEGLNMADFGWGTAGAAAVTLSFWVRSSLTGTFGGSLRNSAANRCYPFSYTISSANTWEQKSITVVGDTTGTWLTTNGVGMYINFSIGTGATLSGSAGSWVGANYLSATGATSVVGTLGATFYITGVQLEKGSTATSFDYRPYGKELALCQRYYIKAGGQRVVGGGGNTTTVTLNTPVPVTMRTTPTATGGTNAVRRYDNTAAGNEGAGVVTTGGFYDTNVQINVSGLTGVSDNMLYFVAFSSLAFSAEL